MSARTTKTILGAVLIAGIAPLWAGENGIERPDTEEMWCLREVVQNLSDLSRFIDGKPLPWEVPLRREAERLEIPVYSVTVDGKKAEFELTGPVWSPQTYGAFTRLVLPGPDATELPSGSMDLATALLNPRFPVLWEEERRISDFLAEHPRSPGAHVQAALLMGTIGLNDYAGVFRDVRIPLNRMTAHLAAADHFGIPADEPGRQLAEAIRLTLCGQQAEALDALAAMEGVFPENTTWESWLRLLRLRNTMDWREGRQEAQRGPPGLRHEYFRALVHAFGPTEAIGFLEERRRRSEPLPAWWRAPNERSLPVRAGHYFTRDSVDFELGELGTVARRFGIEPGGEGWGWMKDFLDAPPGTFVVVQEDGQPAVEVAGRNFWGNFLQRHLMQALSRTYRFLRNGWAVHERAREFKAEVLEMLPDLRYRPFLERLMARTDAEYAATNPACIEIIENTPEIVTPAMWDCLRRDYRDKKVDVEIPDYHIWFSPEVPRGTAFDAGIRVYQIGVGDESDPVWMGTLSKRAPYDYPVIREYVFALAGQNKKNETSELIGAHLGPLAEYHVRSMNWLAGSQESSPDDYEKTMGALAALDPDKFIDMGRYFANLKIPEKAERYYREAFEKANDRVKMAVWSAWLVEHYHAEGRKEEAELVAQAAGRTYAYGGLEVQAWLLEATERHDEAQDVYRRIDERYEGGVPINEMPYLLRRRESGEETDPERYKKLAGGVFPRGVARVGLEDFTKAPKQGVLVKSHTESMDPFGLRPGNVIVALDGYRTDTLQQYLLIRKISEDPQMELIVWDGSAYRLAKGTLPKRRFGADMEDYKP